MPHFDFFRRPPQWLRVALAALLLGLALNSIAHVTHQHDAAAAPAAHGVVCGYCVSFGGMADAPRHSYIASAAPAAGRLPVAAAPAHVRVEPQTSARPRAPPLA